MDRIQQKAESVLLPIGYTTTATLSSVPFWPQDLHAWLSVTAVFFACLAGFTTFYLNLVVIRQKTRKRKNAKVLKQKPKKS